jgi:hypothetical protein
MHSASIVAGGRLSEIREVLSIVPVLTRELKLAAIPSMGNKGVIAIHATG